MPPSKTAKLNLPFIMPAQAQKHIPHNEALLTLDALYGLSVISDNFTEPPETLDENTRYLISSPAEGAWLAKDNQIAMWRESMWHYYLPQPGWQCFIEDAQCVKIWINGSWQSQQSLELSAGLSVSSLGVNSAADETNRLSLSSSNALFNHAGNSHRLSINKQGVADTGALVFQTNFSARAEIGVSGDDNFRIKVSNDGINFHETMHVDGQNGIVSFPKGIQHTLTQNPIVSFLPSATRSVWSFGSARPATPRSYIIDSVSGGTINLTTSDANTLFSDGMRNISMVRVWNVSKAPPEPCWINYNNSSVQINIANAIDITGWFAGEILQLGDPVGEVESGLNSLGMVAVDVSNYLFNEYGAVFKQKAVSMFMEASAVNGPSRLGTSETGEEVFNATSLSEGSSNSLSMILPCSVPSPISNSNLVYFDEALLTGATDFSILKARLTGVWVE